MLDKWPCNVIFLVIVNVFKPAKDALVGLWLEIKKFVYGCCSRLRKLPSEFRGRPGAARPGAVRPGAGAVGNLKPKEVKVLKKAAAKLLLEDKKKTFMWKP